MLKIFLECQEISISCRLWEISDFTCYLSKCKSDFDWIEWFSGFQYSLQFAIFSFINRKFQLFNLNSRRVFLNHWAEKRVKFVTRIPAHFCYLFWQTSAFTRKTSCHTLTMEFDVLSRNFPFSFSVCVYNDAIICFLFVTTMISN